MNKELIYEFYELEYKTSQLKLRNPEHPNLMKMEGRLREVCNSLLKDMKDYVEANILNNFEWMFEGIDEDYEESEYLTGDKPLEHGIMEDKRDAYKTLSRAYKSDELGDKVAGVSFGFNWYHASGDIATAFDIEDGFLNEMTEGKYIPKWDKELKKIAKIDVSQIKQSVYRDLYANFIKNAELLQATDEKTKQECLKICAETFGEMSGGYDNAYGMLSSMVDWGYSYVYKVRDKIAGCILLNPMNINEMIPSNIIESNEDLKSTNNKSGIISLGLVIVPEFRNSGIGRDFFQIYNTLPFDYVWGAVDVRLGVIDMYKRMGFKVVNFEGIVDIVIKQLK